LRHTYVDLNGALKMLVPIVERHRDRFKRFWLRADAAFGKPEIYDAGKMVKGYNGRAEIENRIKEGKNTRRWHVHVSSAFPLDHHFRAVFDAG
jgi:hypothetical protein